MAMYSPKRARTAATALATRRRIVSALSQPKRMASIFMPCGQTTNAYSPATMRQPPHDHSARSPAPCTATINGRGSRAPSGGHTYASCPPSSSRCSIHATPTKGGSAGARAEEDEDGANAADAEGGAGGGRLLWGTEPELVEPRQLDTASIPAKSNADLTVNARAEFRTEQLRGGASFSSGSRREPDSHNW